MRNFTHVLAAGLTLASLSQARTTHAQTIGAAATSAPTNEPRLHARYRPRLILGFEGGAGAFAEGAFGFDKGLGRATSGGPVWGARVGVEVFSFLGIEARYLGMYNDAISNMNPGGRVALVTNAGLVVVCLTAPLPYGRPYIFGGVGYYSTGVVATDAARQASTLHASSELGIPVGIGFEVPLPHHVSLAAEGTYHVLVGENFSSASELAGGDPLTATLAFRARF